MNIVVVHYAVLRGYSDGLRCNRHTHKNTLSNFKCVCTSGTSFTNHNCSSNSPAMQTWNSVRQPLRRNARSIPNDNPSESPFLWFTRNILKFLGSTQHELWILNCIHPIDIRYSLVLTHLACDSIFNLFESCLFYKCKEKTSFDVIFGIEFSILFVESLWILSTRAFYEFICIFKCCTQQRSQHLRVWAIRKTYLCIDACLYIRL